MRQAIDAFLANPLPGNPAGGPKAWRAAREFYGQTEAFRFYGGPIDDDNGPEGRLNAWPMDESYVDKVAGQPGGRPDQRPFLRHQQGRHRRPERA
jgi:putative iron-regulated protein